MTETGMQTSLVAEKLAQLEQLLDRPFVGHNRDDSNWMANFRVAALIRLICVH